MNTFLGFGDVTLFNIKIFSLERGYTMYFEQQMPQTL